MADRDIDQARRGLYSRNGRRRLHDTPREEDRGLDPGPARAQPGRTEWYNAAPRRWAEEYPQGGDATYECDEILLHTRADDHDHPGPRDLRCDTLRRATPDPMGSRRDGHC